MIRTYSLSNLAQWCQTEVSTQASVQAIPKATPRQALPHTPEKKRKVDDFWLKASKISFTHFQPTDKDEKKDKKESLKDRIKIFLTSVTKSSPSKKVKTSSPTKFNVSPRKTQSAKRKPIDERPILVLDLDETLIHSNFQPIINPDFICTYGSEDNKQFNYVKVRPGARELLNYLSLYYQIVIFTAGIESYAKEVISKLDTQKVVSKVFYRDSCLSSSKIGRAHV